MHTEHAHTFIHITYKSTAPESRTPLDRISLTLVGIIGHYGLIKGADATTFTLQLYGKGRTTSSRQHKPQASSTTIRTEINAWKHTRLEYEGLFTY